MYILCPQYDRGAFVSSFVSRMRLSRQGGLVLGAFVATLALLGSTQHAAAAVKPPPAGSPVVATYHGVASINGVGTAKKQGTSQVLHVSVPNGHYMRIINKSVRHEGRERALAYSGVDFTPECIRKRGQSKCYLGTTGIRKRGESAYAGVNGTGRTTTHNIEVDLQHDTHSKSTVIFEVRIVKLKS